MPTLLWAGRYRFSIVMADCAEPPRPSTGPMFDEDISAVSSADASRSSPVELTSARSR